MSTEGSLQYLVTEAVPWMSGGSSFFQPCCLLLVLSLSIADKDTSLVRQAGLRVVTRVLGYGSRI